MNLVAKLKAKKEGELLITDFCPEQVNGLLGKYISNQKSKILDMGCGPGEFLALLKEKNYADLYGTDILYRDALQNRLSADRFFCMDLNKGAMPKPDNYFDAIIAWEVFEHLENPYHALREAYRVLKPGGVFIISMPNPFSLLSKFVFLKHGNLPRWPRRYSGWDLGHITIFTKDVFWKAFLKDYFDLLERKFWFGEFTYGFLKNFDGMYPENELFGRFIVYVMRKKTNRNSRYPRETQENKNLLY